MALTINGGLLVQIEPRAQATEPEPESPVGQESGNNDESAPGSIEN